MFRTPRSSTALAAALLALAGCSNFSVGGGDSGGGGGAATAQAEGVTPEALRAAVKDEPLRRFYEARQWQSAWSAEGAEQLKGALRNAVNHGIDPKTFLADAESGGSAVEKEVAMSRAALAYADALAHGRSDPTKLFEDYTIARNQVDVPAGLAQAVSQGQGAQWIEGLAPQDEEYRALSQAYVQHLQAAQQPQQGQQQQGQNGQEKQQVAAKGKEKAKAESREKQAAKAAPAVPRDRAVVLAVNMERRRWLPRQPEATRIDVNTAGTFLKYIRDNQVADQRVVVVGEPGWETPQLGSPMFRLVANPDWTVPESIEKDELAKLSPAQLQRKNMARENGRIVQQPGPDNALGQVKFDLKNDEAIYLHDTPAKAFFQKPQRHLSHGCVRVNDAIGFARLIAEHYGVREEFEKAHSQAPKKGEGDNVKPAFINLPQELPVRLLYHTAFLDNGQLQFTPDPYGWDAKVAQALGLPVPPASQINQESAEQKRQRRESDFGP
ncbi:MAG TPA: L,D-transpeptidase family protein [Allosphingosinicella sp.]|nr:L,D-transpeptidase family protein [Allosphingosinicella sp.]